MSITIDQAIEKLQQIRDQSPLKGETVLTLCEQEREYIDIDDIKFDACDGEGGLVLIKINP